MGVIRLVLAISVVLAHSSAPDTYLLSGRSAVECFFVISGFYMALVMDTKYGRLDKHVWRTFVGARFLRLYPIYVVVIFATVLVLAADAVMGQGTLLTANLGLLSPVALAVFALAHLTMLGQDALMFAAVNDHGGLYFTSNFAVEPHPAYQFLLIPQAWSISIEVVFYLMVPWLARRSTAILVAGLVASLGCRLALTWAGLTNDPWTYRFFPAELSLFLAGMIAFRLSKDHLAWSRRSGRVAFALAMAAVLAYPLYHAVVGVQVLLPLAFAAAVPAIFAWTKRSRRDRWIGELSYPLYMSHLLVALVLELAGIQLTPVVLLPSALVVATGLMIVVDQPIETWRARRISAALGRKDAPQPEPAPL